MSKDPIAAVVLAAGQGTRMKSQLPKVLHPLAGRSMLAQLLATIDALGSEQRAEKRIVVASPANRNAIDAAIPGLDLAIQDPPLGTGHAMMAAREKLSGFSGDVLMLFADSPLISVETLQNMLSARRGKDDPAVVVMGFRPGDTAEYGRLIVDDGGNLERIVEHHDTSAAERQTDLCNSGFMAIDGSVLGQLLDELGNDNAKGEYYLTDIVEIANCLGRRCAVVEANEIEAHGINSRDQLAQAEAVMQNRLRHAAMAAGVTLLDPASVYFSHDSVIGQDVTIQPHVYFGPGADDGDIGICRNALRPGGNRGGREESREGPAPRHRRSALQLSSQELKLRSISIGNILSLISGRQNQIPTSPLWLPWFALLDSTV